eukprot:TRINITY_DN4564_c0_g1_i1.p2 TRINITY_DN4564_c0_g1~~TRINITY_DN4564_c0_g1_i1.p2  ORF type:complete len:177 (+),score=8.17 TRINITY_DN4564_c0_g1_i1:57-587(+)
MTPIMALAVLVLNAPPAVADMPDIVNTSSVELQEEHGTSSSRESVDQGTQAWGQARNGSLRGAGYMNFTLESAGELGADNVTGSMNTSGSFVGADNVPNESDVSPFQVCTTPAGAHTCHFSGGGKLGTPAHSTDCSPHKCQVRYDCLDGPNRCAQVVHVCMLPTSEDHHWKSFCLR